MNEYTRDYGKVGVTFQKYQLNKVVEELTLTTQGSELFVSLRPTKITASLAASSDWFQITDFADMLVAINDVKGDADDAIAYINSIKTACDNALSEINSNAENVIGGIRNTGNNAISAFNENAAAAIIKIVADASEELAKLTSATQDAVDKNAEITANERDRAAAELIRNQNEDNRIENERKRNDVEVERNNNEEKRERQENAREEEWAHIKTEINTTVKNANDAAAEILGKSDVIEQAINDANNAASAANNSTDDANAAEKVRAAAEVQRQQTFETNEAEREKTASDQRTAETADFNAQMDRQQAEFESKEATRDAANEAALNASEQLSQLAQKVNTEILGEDSSIQIESLGSWGNGRIRANNTGIVIPIGTETNYSNISVDISGFNKITSSSKYEYDNYDVTTVAFTDVNNILLYSIGASVIDGYAPDFITVTESGYVIDVNAVLAKYPTAKKFYTCRKNSSNGTFTWILSSENTSSLKKNVESNTERITKIEEEISKKSDKTFVPIDGWKSGRIDPTGAVAADDAREYIEVSVSNLSQVNINVNSAGSSTYSVLMDDDDNIIKSWNNQPIKETIYPSKDYPTATRLLVTNRTTYTERSVEIAGLLPETLVTSKEKEALEKLSNNTQRSVDTAVGVSYANVINISIKKGDVFGIKVQGNSGLLKDDIGTLRFTYDDNTTFDPESTIKCLDFNKTYTALKNIKKISVSRSSSGVIGNGSITIIVNADAYYTKDETNFAIRSIANAPVYVSNTGNDSNDGSERTPFATFAKALSVGASIIYVESGTYTEGINITGKKLTIMPYNGRKFTIDASSLSVPAIYAQKSDLIIKGMTAKDSTTYGFRLLGCIGELRDCEAFGCTNDGFEFGGSAMNVYDCFAHDCKVDGFGSHPYGNFIGMVNFYNCIADNNADDGLSFHQNECANVYGGKYSNNTNGGVVPYGQSVINVYNAVLEGNDFGLYGFQSDTIGNNPKIVSSGNLIKGNRVGIKGNYYDIVSINDKYSGNTTDNNVTNGTLEQY